jgi:hypothetical protein
MSVGTVGFRVKLLVVGEGTGEEWFRMWKGRWVVVIFWN